MHCSKCGFHMCDSLNLTGLECIDCKERKSLIVEDAKIHDHDHALCHYCEGCEACDALMAENGRKRLQRRKTE